MNRPFPTFTAHVGQVFWGPVLLSQASVDGLLTIFEREGAVRLWIELDEANVAAGGIASVTSMRAA